MVGGQEVWHVRTYVFPRYEGDELYRLRPLKGFVSAEDRAHFAARLRTAWNDERQPSTSVR